MRCRFLFLYALLLLLACRASQDAQPEAGAPDAGPDAAQDASREPPGGEAPSSSYASAPTVVRRDGGTVSFRRPALTGESLRAARIPTPPDPRILNCTTTATDKATLMACLDALTRPEVPAADAGYRILAAVRPPIVNPSWSVPAWFVSSSGKDGNSCTTSGAPCKTFGEIEARWTTREPDISVAVTVTVLTNMPSTDRFVFRPHIMEGGSFYLFGTWTQVATGTLASVVAKSTSAADGRLRADLGAPASGHFAAGQFLVNTTHAAVAPVQAVLSGTTVALGQPFVSNVPAAPTFPVNAPAEVDTWANGDTWQLMQLPTVYLSALEPTSPENNGSNETNFAFLEHVYVPAPAGVGLNISYLGQTVRASECWFDPFVDFREGGIGDTQLANSVMAGGVALVNVLAMGGVLGSASSVSQVALVGGAIDGDTVLGGELFVESLGLASFSGVPSIGSMDVVAGSKAKIFVFGPVTMFNIYYSSTHLYGTYMLDVSGAGFASMGSTTLSYLTSATASFLGVPTFSVDGNATACAVDDTHTPSQRYCGRTITAAAIDAAIGGSAGTGFGGIVHGYGDSLIQLETPATVAAPSNYYVAGTGISLTSSGGQLTIASTSSAAVASVTGAASTICSPTTGAVVCTTSNTVANGLTGATSFNAHGLVVGEGTGPLSSTAAGASGVPLLGQGGAADPAYGALNLAGGSSIVAGALPDTNGGLGSNQNANGALAGCVLFWSGSHTASCIQPGTAGFLLYSDSATSETWGSPLTSHYGSGSVTLTASHQRVAVTSITSPAGFAGNFVSTAHCNFTGSANLAANTASCCISVNSTTTCASNEYTVNVLEIGSTGPSNALCAVGFQSNITAATTLTIGALALETGLTSETATCDVEAWITQ